jgi:hypothetical protein
MTVFRICNYYISTNYKKTEARERFEEVLSDYLNADPDVQFRLDNFIESITEDGQDFEILLELDEDEVDIEYNEEDIDDLIEDITNGYVAEDDDEDGYIDESEDEIGEDEE